MLLAYRVTLCNIVACAAFLLNAFVPWGSSPWKGVLAQVIVQLGNLVLMIANLFCLCSMSRLAEEHLDSLHVYVHRILPSLPTRRSVVSSRKIHATLT